MRVWINGIGFTFLKWPNYPLIMYEAITGPLHFLLIIGILLILFRFRKANWAMYWTYLKVNILKALFAVVICLILFYSFDMSSKLNPYPPYPGWIISPWVCGISCCWIDASRSDSMEKQMKESSVYTVVVCKPSGHSYQPTTNERLDF